MRIYTREELGSRPFRTPPTIVPLSRRQEVTIHYPGAGTPPRELADYRRWIERIHMDERGWRGVGYNYFVDAYGKVGEGAGRDVVGAHSPPHNVDGISINIWTSNGEPTEAGLRAARELYDDLCREAGRKLRIGWHGRDYATACPGHDLITWCKAGMPISDDEAASIDPPKDTTAPKPPVPAKWDGKSFPGSSAFKIGQSHPAVTVLGQRLVAHGFGRFYKEGPGPRFTSVDRDATRAFQLAQGYVGTGADGYPGPQTWAALMKAPTKKPAPKPKPKAPAFPKGIGPGKRSPSAIALQKQLQKAGFMPKSVKTDPNYGPQTQNAVAKFHNKHQQFRSVGKTNDPAIGPKGWTYLFTKY